MRSPSLDYPHPPSQTSDGQVVGADRRPPADTIRMGPTVGSPGVSASEGPRPETAQQKPRGNAVPCTNNPVGPVAAPPCKQPKSAPAPAPTAITSALPWL